MQHFFVTTDQVHEETIWIEGSDVNHLKNVLRMKQGEQLYVSDGDNKKYLCEIGEYQKEQAILNILGEEISNSELPSKIYLFQGLPKGDKMELIVQKCVELGVHEIIPVEMKRCVVKLDEKKAHKKVQRWNEISKSAAKQAGRGLIPQVREVFKFKNAINYAEELDVVLVPYELAEGMDHTKKVIESIEPGQSIGIFIGPEGGFEKEEVLELVEHGAKEITLGNRILRTETAGFTTLAFLMYHLET